jgi:thioredoxin-dependent peroxiredoxin
MKCNTLLGIGLGLMLAASVQGATNQVRLAEGQLAPAFSLASTGGTASLAGSNGQWQVLCFYVKASTPPAVKELSALRDRYADIQKLQATVLGVSRDDVAALKTFKQECQLPFELASDPDKAVAKAYGILGFGGLYQRRSFLIDPKGRIAHVFYGVTINKHGDEIIDALRKCQADAAGKP